MGLRISLLYLESTTQTLGLLYMSLASLDQGPCNVYLLGGIIVFALCCFPFMFFYVFSLVAGLILLDLSFMM